MGETVVLVHTGEYQKASIIVPKVLCLWHVILRFGKCWSLNSELVECAVILLCLRRQADCIVSEMVAVHIGEQYQKAPKVFDLIKEYKEKEIGYTTQKSILCMVNLKTVMTPTWSGCLTRAWIVCDESAELKGKVWASMGAYRRYLI